MNIYLAGPMRGIPHFNFPRFNQVAALLRSAGHEVFNPAEADLKRHGGKDFSVDNPTGDVVQAAAEAKFSLRDALSDDTHFICNHGEAIALLPGWEQSSGALAEFFLARALAGQVPYKFIYLMEDKDQLLFMSSVSETES